ncbi:sialidase family protein [Desulfospira joergensenii]|uniref:sialidase family protein n=1 Tax=Desulfospira joergensenii TaxID=53329 RepID=UPI00042527DE|nr:sialidase family protein [Desulfospira joergensenii]
MKERLRLNINHRFTIIPKEQGRYHSFPTLAIIGDKIWLACRLAHVNPKMPHGSDGAVRLFWTTPEQPAEWTQANAGFKPGKDSSNELDAILSAPGKDQIFLISRDYRRERKSTTFISCWSQNKFQGFVSGESPAERTPLSQIGPGNMTSFGHIRRDNKGMLLMSGYLAAEGETQPSPVLLASEDGSKWHLHARLAMSGSENTLLTEFTLGHQGGTNWFALLRNETRPCPVMLLNSKDNGKTWTAPKPTDIFGHAPMVLKTGNRRFLVLYRDLSGDKPGISIGISTDDGSTWRKLSKLASYDPDHIWEGGYGDFVPIGNSKFLAVYYTCDQDASPWIEGVVFSLEKEKQ